MNVRIIQIPYDSGHRSRRMGRGPEYFVQHGVQKHLQQQGHSVQMHTIEPDSNFLAEIGTAFELNRKLARHTRSVISDKSFPLVLAGNCNCCIGILGGVQPDGTGLIWFDGHGDFNTPETTASGFLDGMSLAIATGRCWRNLARSVPGFKPLPEEHVVLIGARDFDSEEKRALDESKIRLVEASTIRQRGAREALDQALSALASRVQKVYVHIDLDVLDPNEAPANQYSPPDGLSLREAEEAVNFIREKFPICALSIGAYDPDYDPNGSGLRAGFRLMELLLR